MIFVDTSFFFAFFSEDDVNHGRVVEVLEGFEGRNLAEILVTTDHVVFETITLTRYRISHDSAVDCLSFVVMEKHGIREALAVDEDFAHRFIARPGHRQRA